ncbi:MAG: DNA repair protein RecO [Pontiellaceae bacterium]|nr:DNA repair protein RecO [Pontiellaceae bacterium]
MIVRTTAIPLASYPYSSTSRIVHWLTRTHGKVSTLLKGAQRPKSAFLGEYDLFNTSELLYFEKRVNTLHTGKECALLHRRSTFNSDWRAMQTASYLTALLNKTTPEEAPCPDQFELYEELLDLAEEYGRHIQFMIWAELFFSTQQGHSPHLKDCSLCRAVEALRFCASNGGTLCASCTKEHKLPTLECSPDVLAILRAWRSADHPASAIKTQLTAKQLTALNAIMSAFMLYQFNMPTELRTKALFV